MPRNAGQLRQRVGRRHGVRCAGATAVSTALLAAAVVGLAPAASGASAVSPANDEFVSAQPIAGPSGSVPGTTLEATKEPGEPQHAGNAGGASVWYRWSAPATGDVAFDTCSASFDTVLAVYRGNRVTALTRVASNDDACADQSLVFFRATAGVVYSIAVDGFRGDADVPSGPFTLRWRTVSAPANDDFAAAQELSGATGTVDGENLGAGSEPGERRVEDAVGASVWYRWTPPSTGTATLETCGSSFDTIIAVHTGAAVSALTLVASNDDSCGVQSRVRFAARAGTAYSIVVDGRGARSRGLVRLAWSLVARPANDDFAGARAIRGPRGAVRSSNEGALGQPGEPEHADYRPGASLWYVWRAPRTMGITFETCETTFDTVLAVYRGASVRKLVRVDESDDDDDCSDEQGGSRVDFLARKGVVYRVVVDGAGGARGLFVLRWHPADRSADPCVVPDVRGLRLRAARAALERADCLVGRIAYAPSAIVPAGFVTEQFPRPGWELPFLGRVALEVSRGRPR